MAGGAATGAGLGIMGGILGGIGDIMASTKYKRPSVPQPGGQEQRLRSLAQGQLIGGGLESLSGEQLYNSLAPILMGMAPGMSMTPAATGGGGGTAGAAGGTGGAGGSYPGAPAAPGTNNAPMTAYQSALQRYQDAQGRNQQIQNLQDQLKSMPKGPDKKATRQQLQQLKKQNKGSPTVPQLERQVYQAGATAPQINVSQNAPPTPSTGPGTIAGSQLSPTAQSTLAQIMGWMHGASDASQGTQTPPMQSAQGSFLSDYSNALNATPSPYAPASQTASQPISQPASGT